MLRLGRDHLMLGHYTQAYHHALLFQLATARPVLLSFEHEGGMLPAHQIGLELLGKLELGEDLAIKYGFGVGNGRGQSSKDVLNRFDRNDFKSLIATVSVQPLAVEGLEFGVSGYIDRIPAGFTDDDGVVLIDEEIDEVIGAVHAVLISYPVEAQVEGYYLRHEGRDSGMSSDLVGGYAQLGYTFGSTTPYARLEYVRCDASNVFFNISSTQDRVVELRTGLRYSLASQAVLKFEYVGDFENKIHGGVLQAAFGM